MEPRSKRKSAPKYCMVCFGDDPTATFAHKTDRIYSGIDPVMSHPILGYFCEECVDSKFVKKNYTSIRKVEGLREEPELTSEVKKNLAAYFKKRARKKANPDKVPLTITK